MTEGADIGKERGLSLSRLREVLDYDQETGVMRFRVRCGRQRAGSIAGTVSEGRIFVQVDGVRMRAHRVAWLLATGTYAVGLIDHLDGDGQNNSFSNLREATHAINQQNQRRAQRSSRTGILGASPFGKRFRARIWIDGRDRHIGLFATPEEAHQAYVMAKRQLHPGSLL